jgi:hypothetical protein
LRLGLLGVLAGCVVGAILPFVTDPIFEDDTAMKAILTAMLLAVSLANIYVVRGLVLPAQMLVAGAPDRPLDAAEFQRAAQSAATLAMTFLAAKGAYAIILGLFTGWPWVVIPFAAIALVEFGVYGSYLGQHLDRIWRDKIQLSA